MSLAVLKGRALSGMDAPEVTVEVHLANGLPSFATLGLNKPSLIMFCRYFEINTRQIVHKPTGPD